MRAALLLVFLTACRANEVVAPVVAPVTPQPEPAPKKNNELFPLVEGAVYEYDATFGGKHAHERRVVRRSGEFSYFVDVDAEKDDNPSIGSNAFGLGVYRVSDAGIETADAYFRDDIKKVTTLQLAVKYPIEPGATTTLMGGKKLETKVIGPETITVPAGTFECVRLDQREVWSEVTHEGSVWLARGVGTVKRVYVTGRTEVLTAYRMP